ncbi:hypothetical protein [Actinokineospora fastidiosa]|uniref:Uncharacterized protein n=1 Tax=Actinokineospora fastidiosa TaxID=1816 RepID=A0A918GB04_9PSEU|nr:hypothetical protein [Actinokineospora fastidiosa]GGS26602.1 hypothetical protein GCM10010171_20130 [Actinokineospora fastidiosa]
MGFARAVRIGALAPAVPAAASDGAVVIDAGAAQIAASRRSA